MIRGLKDADENEREEELLFYNPVNREALPVTGDLVCPG